VTPAERARQIDKEEFAAECAAVRKRALAYAKHCRKAERQRIKALSSGVEPAPVSFAAMKIGREPVKHCVNGEYRTFDGWAKHLGVTTGALLARRRKLGSLDAAIAMGVGSQRGRLPKSIEFNGETRTFKQWAEHLGIKEDTLRQRMHYGRTVYEAIALGSHKGCGKPGVVSNLPASERTGGGSTAQESPEITFSEKAEIA
jgi:hypothetical protein